MMTIRLGEVMGKLTPIEQKCRVKGRQMTDIIRNLALICEEWEGYMVYLDQEKAFDRLNHKYLFLILEEMGIGGRFL